MARKEARVGQLTMDDVARIAGVDKSTVSRALAGSPLVTAETREHVRGVAKQYGYTLNTMASGLRSQRTRIVAVVIPLAHDAAQPIADPFFMEMVAHLADRLSDRGYDLLLSKVAAPNAHWIGALQRSRKADGVILIGQSLEHEQIAIAAAEGVPLVVWGARVPDDAYITVGTDNFAGGLLATRHLAERGRRIIAFAGDRRLPEIAQRYGGYVAGLSGAGLIADPRLVVPTNFEPDDAIKAIALLLNSNPDIDGIVATADVIAIAAIRCLVASGRRVPEDVSVTGFDDIAMAAHMSPPLTTIRQDIARGAALLSERVADRIDGKPIQPVEMQPTLVIRQSS